MSGAPAPVELRGVSKHFAGIPVLKGVDLTLNPGQVHGLIGANGSGKSTLIKVLAGVYRHDEGMLLSDEKEVSVVTPDWASRNGLRFIHQHPGLFEEMSVVDNISIGARYRHSKGIVTESAERTAAQGALDSIGVALDVDLLVRDLSPAQRTMVAVARAVQQIPGAAPTRVLVLDEPTAALNDDEAARLFEVVHRVRQLGIAVLFVSHRLQEVVDHCDEVTVLRDGERIAHLSGSEITENALVKLVISRELAADHAEAETIRHDRPELIVDDISSSHWSGLSFTVAPGEIVGVAGLLGSGRSELLQSIAGLRRITAGQINLGDEPLPTGDPVGSARRGITYTSESRIESGSFPGLTLSENALLGVRTPPRRKWGLLSSRNDRAEALQIIDQYDVRPPRPDHEFWALSGGNQQKVILARAIREAPDVILLDEPTQAVDVGAKAEIHRIIVELARQGTIVLVVSSDFPELLQLSHRVVVLRSGRLVADVATSQLTEEELLELAAVDVQASTTSLEEQVHEQG